MPDDVFNSCVEQGAKGKRTAKTQKRVLLSKAVEAKLRRNEAGAWQRAAAALDRHDDEEADLALAELATESDSRRRAARARAALGVTRR